jgi:hypothetical protein
MREKNKTLLEIILYFSVIVILLMISPAIISYLVKSIVAGIIIDIVLIKTKFIRKSLKESISPIYIIIGFIFAILIGCYFYDIWIYSSKVAAIGSHIGISGSTLLIIITVIGVLISTPMFMLMAFKLAYYVESGKEILNEKDIDFLENIGLENSYRFYSLKKSLLLVFGIYIFGIVAIIRANFNYIDDLGRVSGGYKGWGNFSRILSNILSTFIHMDNYLTDISPLTQVITALIMAFSGILLLVIICDRVQFTLIEVLSLISLCLNPYFLECISYKFDSPYMALSILASIFPLIYRNRNTFEYIFISILGTIIMCTTYQASSGVYPMLVILIMLLMWNNREPLNKVLMFCINSIVGYGLGILIFRLLIMIPTSQDNYTSNSLPSIKEFIPNLTKYYKLVMSDFKVWWLIIVLLTIIGFIYTMVQQSKQDRLLSIIMTVIAIICMCLLCFGMYPALEAPLFSPRAMYGFGILITLLGVCTVKNSKQIFFTVPILMLSWTFFVFTFTYGNALSVQEEYTEFRISQVINDLNDLEILQNDKEIVVQIEGDIGQSPILEAMPQDYQMLNRLIPSTFCGNWKWGKRKFFNYYGLKNIVEDTEIDLTTYNLPILEDHMYHTIYGNDSYILIELK